MRKWRKRLNLSLLIIGRYPQLIQEGDKMIDQLYLKQFNKIYEDQDIIIKKVSEKVVRDFMREIENV